MSQGSSVDCPNGGRVQLLLRLGYDGSGFFGVTPQPGRPTVLRSVRAILEETLGTRLRALQVAARTDAGVHAIENLATCWVRDPIDLPARLDGLNRRFGIGDPVLRMEARVVPTEVFARTLASGKHYRYRIEPEHDPAWIADIRRRDLARRRDPAAHPPLPPEQARIWQVAPALDVDAMAVAATHLVGTHDFTSFKVGPMGDRSPVRTIHAIDIRRTTRRGHPQVVVDVVGSSFLRKMVRILVGTLAEVGAGLRDPAELPSMLAARSRQVSGQAALARGLTLVRLLPRPSWFPDPWPEPLLEDRPTGAGPDRRPP